MSVTKRAHVVATPIPWTVTVDRSAYGTWIVRVRPANGGAQERVHEAMRRESVDAVATFLRCCEPACAAAYNANQRPQPAPGDSHWKDGKHE